MNEDFHNGPDKNFWRGRRVFITGHTGFKGSWLSLWLQSLGSKLRGYSLCPPTTPNLFTAANVAQGMESVEGDIRDSEKIITVMAEFLPEIVIHLAAQPLVRRSYQCPIETFDTNVLGTARVLEAIRKIPSVRSVLVITTDKCYQNREWEYGYRESDALGGYDPYSSSKACTEIVVNAYRSSFFCNQEHPERSTVIATARAGNVIGGGDWAEDRLIPDLVTNFMRRKIVKIRNPQSVRPWQHVLEPLHGYLLLVEKLYTGGAAFASAYNFGPDDRDCEDVEFIVRQVQRLWGKDAKYEIVQSLQPHEAGLLKLDSSKAHQHLCWWPRWNVNQSLEKTIGWYRYWHENSNNKSSLQTFTYSQIEQYIGTHPR